MKSENIQGQKEGVSLIREYTEKLNKIHENKPAKELTDSSANAMAQQQLGLTGKDNPLSLSFFKDYI